MTALLAQFLSESRDSLQDIGKSLMLLEKAPDDASLMNELFRLVHTLKGNCGLFEFPELARVLHSCEDLMAVVRDGRLPYSRELADHLMDAIDFVGILCEEIEGRGGIDAIRAEDSMRLAQVLRGMIVPAKDFEKTVPQAADRPGPRKPLLPLEELPEGIRSRVVELLRDGMLLHWIWYAPQAECFYQGDDPFFTARNAPDLVWGRIEPRDAWPPLAELDAYRCALDFHLLTSAPRESLTEHFRYVIDQTRFFPVDPIEFGIFPTEQEGEVSAAVDGLVMEESQAEVRVLSEHESITRDSILAIQKRILSLDDSPVWLEGRFRSVSTVLVNCCRACGDSAGEKEIEAALAETIKRGELSPLLVWIDKRVGGRITGAPGSPGGTSLDARIPSPAAPSPMAPEANTAPDDATAASLDTGRKFGRRADDAFIGAASLKVDQSKIDRLMDLIGEMVVSKNALPYLALRAENQFGVRELAREIKSQYAVINRISEEMHDAIMQVRMMPVSFVFQRFPRMVREISRKLGKEVRLELEGEETEIDKNIIESLADPLVHIIRNSLDHGFETPEARRAAGKPETGTLILRASQDADRVLIHIIDDGRGIDPSVIKRKALEKGIIDEVNFERISDQDAINLVFAAGLTTAEVISDLSGRGVGMDVVRSAVEKVNGSIELRSELGSGTNILISLPLSMAVTKVMIIETDGQLFGVPMDHVVETVRVPRRSITTIKSNMTTVLRDRIIPIKPLNALLGIHSDPRLSADDEFAVLVARIGSELIGLLVDDFQECVDVIQKPLDGVLSFLTAFSGSAIIGDGSVLMVLNIKEAL